MTFSNFNRWFLAGPLFERHWQRIFIFAMIIVPRAFTALYVAYMWFDLIHRIILNLSVVSEIIRVRIVVNHGDHRISRTQNDFWRKILGKTFNTTVTHSRRAVKSSVPVTLQLTKIIGSCKHDKECSVADDIEFGQGSCRKSPWSRSTSRNSRNSIEITCSSNFFFNLYLLPQNC